MLSTLEIRWFREGLIPDDMQVWFINLEGEFSDHPARTDFYLHIKDNDSLGIKVREGMIEIKKRKQSIEIIRFNSGLSGLIESWEKWGFNISENSRDYENISEPKSWIPVNKKRLLRKYSLTGNAIRPISPGTVVSEAFNLELSHIELMGQTCWGLNLEAYGENNLNLEVFRRMGNSLFQDAPLGHMKDAKSCGYPRWIKEISTR